MSGRRLTSCVVFTIGAAAASDDSHRNVAVFEMSILIVLGS